MTKDLKAPEIGLVIETIGNYLLKKKTNCSLYSIIFVIKFKKKLFNRKSERHERERRRSRSRSDRRSSNSHRHRGKFVINIYSNK